MDIILNDFTLPGFGNSFREDVQTKERQIESQQQQIITFFYLKFKFIKSKYGCFITLGIIVVPEIQNLYCVFQLSIFVRRNQSTKC